MLFAIHDLFWWLLNGKKSHAKQGYFSIALETSHWGRFLELCKNHIKQKDSLIVPISTQEIS